VWGQGGSHASTHTQDPDPSGPQLSPVQLTRAAQKAIALAQREKSTWTRAEPSQVPNRHNTHMQTRAPQADLEAEP